MGGSGGAFYGPRRSPDEIIKKLKDEAVASAGQFDTTLAETLNGLLVDYNNRNSDEIQDHLTTIKNILSNELESSIDSLFGGSVAKRTYVDGLSDVDSLLIFPDSPGMLPDRLLQKIRKTLQEKLGDTATVTSGNLAVTVTYKNGPEIQLIPAVSSDGVLKISDVENNTWIDINPSKFSEALTRRNEKCSGKLIPTIKLAKAINAMLPKKLQLTGYHLEALGVSAFGDYSGPKTTSAMLPYFFEKASALVLKPIVDKTGQSTHIDAHLGKADSEERQALSHTLMRLHKRMLNASAAHSKERWLELFGE